VREYDFRRPTKLTREHLRVLQIALEAFARGTTTSLTGALRNGVRMDLIGIEQFSYDDYITSLPNPTFLSLFTLDPLPGKAALALPLDATMAVLDHMLGGPGATVQPERPLTSMEGVLTRTLLENIVEELSLALAPLTALTPELGVFEYNPALAQVTGASETVIVGRFSLALPTRRCEVTLCLPFSSFAPALDKAGMPTLSPREQAARADASRKMATRLEQVPVEVTVRMAPAMLAAEDLINLTEGTLVRLRHPSAVPLEVTAADVTFAHAIPCAHRRRLAAEIVPSPLPVNSKDQH
jgi:flagellar motor switch protein FliM